jgi:hypothetical protein
MKTGDKLDPIALGHEAIDLKSLLHAAGYIMPQGSVAKLPRLPGEVEAQITAMEEDRERYGHCGDSKQFVCSFCNTNNYGDWRVEVVTGQEFIACGDCNKVVEVR